MTVSLPPLPPRSEQTIAPPAAQRRRRGPRVAATVAAVAGVGLAVAAAVATGSGAAPSAPSPTVSITETATTTATATATVTAAPPSSSTPLERTSGPAPASSSADPPAARPQTRRPTTQAAPPPATTQAAPPPAQAHHVSASLNASGGAGRLSVTVSLSTDASSASIVIHATNGSGDHTAATGGPVDGSGAFVAVLTVGAGPVEVYAVVTTSSGTVTTSAAHLEV